MLAQLYAHLRAGYAHDSLERRERLRLTGKQPRILRNPDHGENLGEVRRQPERKNFLPGVRGLNQHLDHKRNAARIDVVHLGEIQKHELRRLLRQTLICAQHRLFRRAGNIAFEA